MRRVIPSDISRTLAVVSAKSKRTAAEVNGFVTLRLPPELVRSLNRRAKQNDRSLSAEIRVALRRHMEREAT